jgi:hypothetical protein
MLSPHTIDLPLYQLTNTCGTIIILCYVYLLKAEVRQD